MCEQHEAALALCVSTSASKSSQISTHGSESRCLMTWTRLKTICVVKHNAVAPNLSTSQLRCPPQWPNALPTL